MKKRGIKPTAQQPDNIEQQRQATAASIIIDNFSSEWPYYEASNFKTLQPPGYSHYCDT